MSKTRAMSFGIRIPHCGPFAGVEVITASAKVAEDLGYDSLWVNDYVLWTRDLHSVHLTSGSVENITDSQKPDYFDSLTTLAYLAGQVKQVKLGVSVLIAPYRHPLIAARAVGTLDNLSGGRVLLGLGVGAGAQTKNVNFQALGVPANKRYRLTERCIATMKAVWGESDAPDDDENIALAREGMFPKPIQNPMPMWMGGAGSRALRIAATMCNGFFPTWFMPDDYRAVSPDLGNTLAERGKTMDDFTLAREIYLCIDADKARAEQIAEKTMANNAKWFTVRGLQDPGERLKLVWSSSLVGNPSSIRRQLEDYASAGVRHMEMKLIYHTWDQFMGMLRLFSREVMDAMDR